MVQMPVAPRYDKYMAMYTSTVKKNSLAREFQKHLPDPSCENSVMDHGNYKK